MLVLSRKHGEAITIGEDITITILATDGGRVKLGIVAPAEIPVHRHEVYRKIGGCGTSLRAAAYA